MSFLKRSCLLLLLLAAIPAYGQITGTIYVDATGGNDDAAGTSPETAWQSISRVNSEIYGPGAQILFKAGESWHNKVLSPRGSGTAEAPIKVGSYGEGPRPALHGDGIVHVIYLLNQEYIEIENLEITNKQVVAEGVTPFKKRAIYIRVGDMGEAQHFHLRNLEIHDVNSSIDKADESTRYYGGIILEVTGLNTPTWFDDVLIENCHLYDIGRSGFSNDSSWWRRGLTSSFGEVIGQKTDGSDELDNWVPSTRMVLRNNLLERISGNGMMLRVSKGTMVEHNRMFYCGKDMSGNAAMNFNTDSLIYQFNEAAYTVYNAGDTDARGLDADYRTKWTIMQYNYIHHNEYGGLVATGGPGGAVSTPRFNEGTVIRYNVLINNRNHAFATSGKLTNIYVYNNVVYNDDPNIGGLNLVRNSDWSGARANGSYYTNNIFYHVASGAGFALGSSRNNVFKNNLFWGNTFASEPSDPGKIKANPLFVNPVQTEGLASMEGFKLQSTSPALGAGIRVLDLPQWDLFGNEIDPEALIDVGVHQTNSKTGTAGENRPEPGKMALQSYPNPVTRVVNLRLQNPSNSRMKVDLFDLMGRHVAVLVDDVGTELTERIDFEALGLPAGTYMLRMTSGRSTLNKVIIYTGR